MGAPFDLDAPFDLLDRAQAGEAAGPAPAAEDLAPALADRFGPPEAAGADAGTGCPCPPRRGHPAGAADPRMAARLRHAARRPVLAA